MAKLDRDVERLQLSVEGLFKLLGGTPSQRERFWEILKGITTPAEFRLAQSGIVAAEREVATVKGSLAAMKKVASETRR